MGMAKLGSFPKMTVWSRCFCLIFLLIVSFEESQLINPGQF